MTLPSPRQRLSIVISAYNEEEALPKLIEEIRASLVGWERLEVIMVNDGSQDRTRDVIDQLTAQQPSRDSLQLIGLHLPDNQGMGAALKRGYQLATEPWVTFLPGDGQISPEMILPLCEAADRGAQAITTYYTNREYSLYRAILSQGLRFLNALIVGVRVTSEGHYLIQRALLQAMPLASDSFMLNLEIPIRAARAQVPMECVGVEVRERQGGRSSATQWKRIFNTFWDLFGLRWRLIKESRGDGHRPRLGRMRRLWLMLKISIFVILIAWAMHHQLFAQTWSALQPLTLIDLGGALMALGLTLCFGVWRWRWILRALHLQEPRFLLGLQLYYEGLFYNTFAPGAVGGDVLRAHWMRAQDQRDSKLHYLVTLSERALGLATLGVFAIWVWGGWLWMLGYLCIGALLLMLTPWLHPSARGTSPRWLVGAALLNTVSHLITFLMYLSLSRSLGISLPTQAWIEALSITILASQLPISVGGLGPREVALVTTLGAYGISQGSALALSFAALATLALHALAGGLIHLMSPATRPAS